MAVGFPARAEGEWTFDVPAEELGEAVFDALELLRWPVKRRGGRTIHATTSMGFRSYGEKIDVTIGPDGTLHVRSKCSWPLQLFDWGKNQDNVDKLLQKVGQVLQA